MEFCRSAIALMMNRASFASELSRKIAPMIVLYFESHIIFCQRRQARFDSLHAREGTTAQFLMSMLRPLML